jgi:hypothetical protein
MDIVLPPALFYGVGIVLILFGALRAVFLGWRQKIQAEPPPPAGEEPEPEQEQEPASARGWARSAGGGYKRHLTFGVLWVVMGLFLVVSTYIKSR